MFWNKKPKLPVTIEDKQWIEEALIAIKEDFGDDYFKSLTTILPTKKYYDYEFSGSEADAEFVLEQTKIYFDLEDVNVQLQFFSDEPIKMDDGAILSTPADINGRWDSASGVYEEVEGEIIIYIETSILRNTIALIATIAHELSHYILLGEHRIDTNDEYLTDLVAIAFGFGIFLGNNRFTYKTERLVNGSAWQMSKNGYLPEQVIAYAMAWLCIYREEEPVWKKHLNPTLLKFFEQSFEYLKVSG